MSDDRMRLLSLCAARVEGKSLDWSLLARCAPGGGLDQLYAGIVTEQSPIGTKTRPLLHSALREGLSDATARVLEELAAAEKVGARLVTVLDEDYPANLREVRDRPPFLFTLGKIEPRDTRAVAVVGTRMASEDGLRRASRLSRELVDEGITVVSGLARGVDTSAHVAALDHGGRTIAVLGTGITKCYPAENRGLLERIASDDHGAVVSQFWPTRPPGRDTFPRRNRVTSGLSQGSVVIEASSTSGAKLQARLAHEHGRDVWLIHSLVTGQPWAAKMVAEGKAREIHQTGEVVNALRQVPRRGEQEEQGPAGQQLVLDF